VGPDLADELSDQAAFVHVRGNVWRDEPGAKGRRQVRPIQQETFVVNSGELTVYSFRGRWELAVVERTNRGARMSDRT
jgi:hypothetical protein